MDRFMALSRVMVADSLGCPDPDLAQRMRFWAYLVAISGDPRMHRVDDHAFRLWEAVMIDAAKAQMAE